MAAVMVTINGKGYRIGCNPGEEAQIITLGAKVEDELQSLKAAVGDVGELRLLVMVALKLADDVTGTRRDNAAKIAEVDAATATLVETFAASLEQAARRIESVAGRLERA